MMWMIYFEDAGIGPEVFDIEEVARERYQDLLVNWNCHLFRAVARYDAAREGASQVTYYDPSTEKDSPLAGCIVANDKHGTLTEGDIKRRDEWLAMQDRMAFKSMVSVGPKVSKLDVERWLRDALRLPPPRTDGRDVLTSRGEWQTVPDAR